METWRLTEASLSDPYPRLLDSTDAVEVGLGLKRRFEVSIKVQVKGDATINDLVELVMQEAGSGK